MTFHCTVCGLEVTLATAFDKRFPSGPLLCDEHWHKERTKRESTPSIEVDADKSGSVVKKEWRF